MRPDELIYDPKGPRCPCCGSDEVYPLEDCADSEWECAACLDYVDE